MERGRALISFNKSTPVVAFRSWHTSLEPTTGDHALSVPKRRGRLHVVSLTKGIADLIGAWRKPRPFHATT